MLFAKSLCIPISLLLTTALLQANNDNYPAGARSAAVSNASVTLVDIWSTFHNQAGLAYLHKPMGALYFENKYLVKELSMQAATVAIPLKPGTIAASCRYFGFPQYYETKVGVAYGMKIAAHLSLGLQIDWLQTYFAEGFGKYDIATEEIGLLAEPIRNFIVGVHLYNPIRAKQNTLPEQQLPTIARIGFRYIFDKQASLMFETEKDINQTPIVKAGIEIAMRNNISFRGGYATGMEQYSFGLGLKPSKINIDLACTHHPVLGFTPQASIGYEF